MSDAELVHTFCRKERLTLYNFLKMHLADQHRSKLSEVEDSGFITTLNEERIKNLIHKEYQYYFKRGKPLEIYKKRFIKTNEFKS